MTEIFWHEFEIQTNWLYTLTKSILLEFVMKKCLKMTVFEWQFTARVCKNASLKITGCRKIYFGF